ncbi:MAG: hypothetical protein CMP11_01410 [Zetaproteobacteria bacterium]|nr:hypothetical protein [Pseudobdellovibrionaceae bacterium]
MISFKLKFLFFVVFLSCDLTLLASSLKENVFANRLNTLEHDPRILTRNLLSFDQDSSLKKDQEEDTVWIKTSCGMTCDRFLKYITDGKKFLFGPESINFSFQGQHEVDNALHFFYQEKNALLILYLSHASWEGDNHLVTLAKAEDKFYLIQSWYKHYSSKMFYRYSTQFKKKNTFEITETSFFLFKMNLIYLLNGKTWGSIEQTSFKKLFELKEKKFLPSIIKNQTKRPVLMCEAELIRF